MKKWILGVLAVLILFTSCASSSKLTEEENQYQQVIELPSMSNDEIFLETNDWLVSTFKNANSVIEYSDKEKGVIIGKINANLPVGAFSLPTDTTWKLRIDIKDGKSRFSFSGMTIVVNMSGNVTTGRFSSINYDLFVDWVRTDFIPSYEKAISLNQDNLDW